MKKIAILSTPRSGTQFMTATLRSFDLKVGHEKMDEDGIVCGFWAWADVTHGELPCAQKIAKTFDPNTKFEYTFHLFRDPLKSLRSMLFVLKNKQVYGRWLEQLGLGGPESDLFRTCLRYWVITHERLLSRDIPRLNIENITEDWIKVAERLGLSRELPRDTRKGNLERKLLRDPVTWRELESLDLSFALRARKLWKKLSSL